MINITFRLARTLSGSAVVKAGGGRFSKLFPFPDCDDVIDRWDDAAQYVADTGDVDHLSFIEIVDEVTELLDDAFLTAECGEWITIETPYTYLPEA